MRILHVTNFYPPVAGGLEVYVDSLAGELAGRGHDVHVASLTKDATPTARGVATHTLQTVTSRLVRYERADRPFPPPVPDPWARSQLRRLAAAIRPDVIHVHSSLGLSVPAIGIPVVQTLHDYAMACQLGTFWRFDGSPCGGPSARECIRCGSGTYGPVKSAAMTAATAIGRRASAPHAVLALSEHMKTVMTPFVGEEIEVIPGLHRPQGGEAEPEGLPCGPFAMFAGDPRSHKGIDTLLDAWRNPALSDVELVIATSRPFEGGLPRGARCLSLRPDQMTWAWRRASAAVVPSLWAEPFGLVAIEAMAAGTPVIASNTGALPEIVTDGVDGILVPPGDPEALAKAVAGVVLGVERLATMSRAATESARRYAPEVIVPRIESVYGRLLASAASRHLDGCGAP